MRRILGSDKFVLIRILELEISSKRDPVRSESDETKFWILKPVYYSV